MSFRIKTSCMQRQMGGVSSKMTPGAEDIAEDHTTVE